MPEQTSIWRKEIHLGRKRGPDSTASVVTPENAVVEPTLDVVEPTVEVAPRATETTQETDARIDAAKAVVAAARNAAHTEAAPTNPVDEQPWWKKEVNLRRSAPAPKPK